MSITFSADEIFEMAEEIERNGACFYRDAASQISDKDTKTFLLEMGDMEQSHLEIFQSMRLELTQADTEMITYDPDDQGALYLQAMADARGTEGKITVDQPLTGKETIEQIIDIAIKAENNSVCFYMGLKDLVPSESGQAQIHKIIKEEMGHIAVLQKKLTALSN